MSASAAVATVPCTDAACGVCDLLTDGTTLTSKLHLVPPTLLLADVHAPVLPPALLADQACASAATHPPPRLLRLCEFLSRTACPVRGPAVSLA